eukprot:6097508-Amphidinium_carterae.1
MLQKTSCLCLAFSGKHTECHTQVLHIHPAIIELPCFQLADSITTCFIAKVTATHLTETTAERDRLRGENVALRREQVAATNRIEHKIRNKSGLETQSGGARACHKKTFKKRCFDNAVASVEQCSCSKDQMEATSMSLQKLSQMQVAHRLVKGRTQ